MTISMIKKHLKDLVGCITFEYNGYSCGVDPLAHDDFDLWYGKEEYKAHSIDEVMKTKFFNGEALEDIVDDLIDMEY